MVQSIALPKECEEILATVSPHKKKQLEDPKNLEDLKKLLTSPKPAWLIWFDTTVIAANLPALWLWDVLSTNRLPDGLRTLDTFADNFDRIPLKGNEDFYRKKSIDANVIKEFCGDEAPIRKFKEAMLSDPQRKAIYEKANPKANPKANKHEFKTALDFTLNIRPPQESKSDELLRFKVGANLHFHEKRLIGWGAVYNPLGEELSIIKKKYLQQLNEYYEYNDYDTIPYVITDTGAPYDVRIAEIIKGEEGGGVWLKEEINKYFTKEQQEEIGAHIEKLDKELKRLADMSPSEHREETKDVRYTTPKEYRKRREGLPRI